MELTKLQKVVQARLCGDNGSRSLLLVAPTGIGKTLAVMADLAVGRRRTVYGVPLRALANGILDKVRRIERDDRRINAVVHHGDIQESQLFSEEVVVTTYDQIVCAVPGLPLSLPLSAGHAVAGALLMSRLVLDEVHLAWGISPEALTILLGILKFRRDLDLQTVVMTATMPEAVARLISDQLDMDLVIAGDDETKEDEALAERKRNRNVLISQVKPKSQKPDEKEVDLTTVVDLLAGRGGKRIYFANTVERLQRAFDLLEKSVDRNQITVLHNRMPGSWRCDREKEARQRFGKESDKGDCLLLTNQVAEAGLDISADFVLSDPAPVDTLIQRAGRCSRWFRNGRTDGSFCLITPPKTRLKDWGLPYRENPVEFTLDALKEIVGKGADASLDWETEQRWIDQAWSGQENKDGTEWVSECLKKTTFALNLFDRASQLHSPGAIASAFRDILSTQVAVLEEGDADSEALLLKKLNSGHFLDASSTSLRRGYALKQKARLVRYQDDELVMKRNPPDLAPGDLLLVPPSVAYLHPFKGLCFGDGLQVDDAIHESELILKDRRKRGYSTTSNPQGLWQHTEGVMRRVGDRLLKDPDYRSTLVKILGRLEPQKPAEELADVIGRLAIVATGFHDLGKCGVRWQQRAHEIDRDPSKKLIGRTGNTAKNFGEPHTPPGFFAAVAACNAALGNLPETMHLVRAIALATARHHSSLLNPSAVRGYQFQPVNATTGFIRQVLEEVGLKLDPAIILEAACCLAGEVPLMLPNDDLFPIYALVGRAILISDREDAAGCVLEESGVRDA